MNRISVTTLEKFRRFMAGASQYDTEASLIESLKGLFKGNDKTDFGGAYHLLIEGEYTDYSGNIWVKDRNNKEYLFNPGQAKPALDYRKAHPNMVHEMDVRKVYTTAFGDIQVTGRVDGIEGANTHDAKTRFKQIVAAEYYDSCQWKFYLDMLGNSTFIYDVFEIKGFDSMPNKKPIILSDVQVMTCESLKFHKEENMADECATILNDFLAYLKNRNFFYLLKPALEEPELNF